MAISTSYDFTVTRNQIIARALRICGALAYGEDATPEQESQASEALNSFVKSLEGDGIRLWTTVNYSGTLTSTGTIALNAEYVGLESLFIRISGADTPMQMITAEDYDLIVDKSAAGQPEKAYWMHSASGGTLYFHPIPATGDTYSIYGRMLRKLGDFDILSDNPDVPSNWLDAVVYGLAAQLSYEYGLDLGRTKLLEEKYIQLKKEAMHTGNERMGKLRMACSFTEVV